MRRRVDAIIDEVIARAYKAVEDDVSISEYARPLETMDRLRVAAALDKQDREDRRRGYRSRHFAA